jgi:hypothetical protein
MYNISANNMEAVATMLDPILENMQQHETMDVRAISCDMVQILTLLRDVTVPNIQLMTQLIYTKSNNAAMNNKFPQKYTPPNGESITSSTALTTCLSESTSASATSRVAFGTLFNFLFSNNVDVGPLGHIASIILLIILFPFSIVVSIIGIIVLILYVFAYVLLPSPDNTDDGLLAFLLIVIFASIIGSPIIIIYKILQNIKEFFGDILDPFLPDRPTPAPIVYTPFPSFDPTPSPINVPVPAISPISPPVAAPVPASSPISPPVTAPVPASSPISPPIKAPVSVSSPISPPVMAPVPVNTVRDAQQASEVAYRLSMVLESPIDTIINVLQNGNMFAGTNRGDGEERIDCDMAAVQCKNDALLDVLPF